MSTLGKSALPFVNFFGKNACVFSISLGWALFKPPEVSRNEAGFILAVIGDLLSCGRC